MVTYVIMAMLTIQPMDNLNYNNLRMISYNCRGYNVTKLPYIASLLTSCDILFLQEHWLSESQLHNLNNISSSHMSTGTCGFDNNEILMGRPYGGCAILWPVNLKGFTHFVDTNNRRLCSLRVCNDDYKLLFINVYMPCQSDNDAYNAYNGVLADIISVIDQFPDHCPILGGDFNVDLNKHVIHSKLLMDVCADNDLRIATLHECCKIDFTYNFCMSRFSFIDHFIVSAAMYDTSIVDCLVRHDGDNLSDHDPIALSLNINWSSIALSKRRVTVKVAWAKASQFDIGKYKHMLQDKLNSVLPPVESLTCHDVMCRNEQHIAQLNSYSSQIIHACLESATETIPSTSQSDGKKTRALPGWNEYVSPARDKSLLWHNIWLECGRPRHGVITDIMRRTRAAYHYAIRFIKRNNSDIIKQRFASAIVENRSRDFWQELKKVNGRTRDAQKTVDGHTDSEYIADMFARKYEDLYTSVSYDEAHMDALKQEIDVNIVAANYDSNCVITFNDITDAVSKLKPGKHDGHFGLSSDHVRNACDELYAHIALLFSALVVHGHVTDDLSFSTVLPIPKGKHLNYSDSANYRGIALCSIFGKLFDSYVLSRYESFLTTSNLQFGFKRGHSTSMCTLILKEVVDYYRTHGSDVYCTMLDATKAFDRVEYCKLIRLLINKQLPAIIIRFLLNIYLCQATRISWNGCNSHCIKVLNGVRQGAVLSPVLFCIYFDELIHELEKSKFGCHIGFLYAGVLAYADDLVLLAPSANATRKMLAICDAFGERYSVTFNANKSKCILCLPCNKPARLSSTVNPVFYIGGNAIQYVNEWPHLGHIISANSDDAHDIMSRRFTLISQINSILCNFRNVDCSTKIRLVKAFCTSFYGCELWNMSNNSIENICTAWRCGIRQVWRLPNTTHSTFLPGLCKTIPLHDLFYKRMLKFVYRCINSQSLIVNFIVRHSILFGRMNSTLGRNVLSCSQRYHTSIYNIIDCSFSPNNIDRSAGVASEDVCRQIAVLNELLQCRDGSLSLSSTLFDGNDVEQLIHAVCVG